MDKPDMDNLDMDKLNTVRPDMDKPNTVKQDMDKLDMDKLNMARQDMDKPGMDNPSMDKPDTAIKMITTMDKKTMVTKNNLMVVTRKKITNTNKIGMVTKIL